MLNRCAVRLLATLVCALSSQAMAQTQSPTGTFFQIFNGTVSGGESGITVRSGDRIAAVLNSEAFTTTLDSAGEFQGLTLTSTMNEPDTIRFELRRGSARYALSANADVDTPFETPFEGSSNPLSAAFNAQTVDLFVGAQLSGPGAGGGGDGDGDGVNSAGPDIDGDGVVTQDDAQLVMRFIIGARRDTENPETLDVNGDALINTDDVVEILRRMGETVATEGGEGEEGDGEGAG